MREVINCSFHLCLNTKSISDVPSSIKMIWSRSQKWYRGFLTNEDTKSISDIFWMAWRDENLSWFKKYLSQQIFGWWIGQGVFVCLAQIGMKKGVLCLAGLFDQFLRNTEEKGPTFSAMVWQMAQAFKRLSSRCVEIQKSAKDVDKLRFRGWILTLAPELQEKTPVVSSMTGFSFLFLSDLYPRNKKEIRWNQQLTLDWVNWY